MARPHVIAFSLVALVGCKDAVHDSTGVAPSASVAAAPPVATAPPPPPAPTSFTIGVATFTSKETLLDECVDFTVTPPADLAGAAGQSIADTIADAMMKSTKGVSRSRIYKPCSEQFRTNPVLATCTARTSLPMKDAGATVTLDSEERYYNLDSLTQSNTYMKNCLDMKGDWQAADHDSDEYRTAVRARARREVEKAQKLLGQ